MYCKWRLIYLMHACASKPRILRCPEKTQFNINWGLKSYSIKDRIQSAFRRPCCSVPCQGGSLCEPPSVLAKSGSPWYPLGTLRTRLLNAMHCIPMGHGSGLHSSTRGMVWFTLAHSGLHGEVVHHGTLPDRFGTSTVRFRGVQAPFWRSLVWVWPGYSKLYKSTWTP